MQIIQFETLGTHCKISRVDPSLHPRRSIESECSAAIPVSNDSRATSTNRALTIQVTCLARTLLCVPCNMRIQNLWPHTHDIPTPWKDSRIRFHHGLRTRLIYSSVWSLTCEARSPNCTRQSILFRPTSGLFGSMG